MRPVTMPPVTMRLMPIKPARAARHVRGLLLVLAAATSSGCEGASEPASPSATGTVEGYHPITIAAGPGAETQWQGRTWRVNAGAVLDEALSYAVQSDADQARIRFELRDTARDRSPRDTPDTRRAELSGSLYGDRGRLPNGVPLWGAMLFRHHAWSDPAAMRALTGGVYGQIHMGSRVGGSPALAFRRSREGLFMVTTRGQHDEEGSVHLRQPLSFDAAHDLVYRVVLHPTEGSLAVWLDGALVVDQAGISIGHEDAGSYWNFGLYFSGGISGSVSAEYAAHVYPARADLLWRARAPLAWPQE